MSREPSQVLPRLPTLDGLRGVLALVVVLWHATSSIVDWFAYPAKFAVLGFFVMSGLVLTRSWERQPAAFLAQRFVRLWPTYAFCLGVGYLIAGSPVDWRQFLWFPLMVPDAEPHIDPPVWSLIVEAWAMPLMPLIVWAGTGPLLRAWCAFMAVCIAFMLTQDVAWQQFWLALSYFVAGAYLARFTPKASWLEAAPAQWLGKISYSLYLSHWLVFALARHAFGTFARLALLPLSLFVGWLFCAVIERPSIAASRRLKAWFTESRASPLAVPGQAR
jgi:peptidoglycan/LPS O-acetylase OafA/YrhL